MCDVFTGNFYFTHVNMEDEMDPGLAYSCMRKNLVIRSVVQGSDTIVKPQQSTEGSTHIMDTNQLDTTTCSY